MILHNNLLFIAPLPPPFDGQSKASLEALNALQSMGWQTNVVNTSRVTLKRSVFTQFIRVFEVLLFFAKIAYFSFSAKYIYLSLSESKLGNVKDILTYMILYPRLRRLTIHMLGGSGMDILLNRSWLTSRINGFFMSQMKGVIVEGNRGCSIFSKYFEPSKITVVPNFVDDFLQVQSNEVSKKFANTTDIQVLYLSNLLPGKGYLDLLNAFILLPDNKKSHLRLKFVGGFSNDEDRVFFLNKINALDGVEYLGPFIDGELKRELYLRSHIFCLPTYYPYEGQPISILEAYATGCFVLTTKHGGIPDIFEDCVNGYIVSPKDPATIRDALCKIIDGLIDLEKIALSNMKEASLKYRSSIYRERIASIFAISSNV